MDNFSAYELAQQRIEQRQRNRNHAYLWLFLAVFFIPISFAAGGGCMIPLAAIAVFFAALSGTGWYFASERGRPGASQVAQEMAWLFGENWEDSSSVHEYSLALERIRKRRVNRTRFFFHLTLFLLANGIILFTIVEKQRTLHEPPGLIPIFMFVWLWALVIHAIRVFPARSRLEIREQKAAEAIRRELEQMTPAKRKNKLKRDVYYTLGDDGELVEVDQEAIHDEKPKNRLQSDADDFS